MFTQSLKHTKQKHPKTYQNVSKHPKIIPKLSLVWSGLVFSGHNNDFLFNNIYRASYTKMYGILHDKFDFLNIEGSKGVELSEKGICICNIRQ